SGPSDQARELADGAVASRPQGSYMLRRILILLDAVSVAAGWLTVLAFPSVTHFRKAFGGPWVLPALVSFVVVASIAFIASQRLYLARVCSVRAVEIVRLGRAALFGGALVYASDKIPGIAVSALGAASGAVLNFLLLFASRAAFRFSLQTSRRRGRFVRPVLIVGANEEGRDLCRLVTDHPELGFRVCGIVGDASGQVGPLDPLDVDLDMEWPVNMPWLGGVDEAVWAARASGANGALVAASALSPAKLNRVVRALLGAGMHVHLSSGLRGIDHRRLVSSPLAHEPLFYVEQTSLSRWQVGVKRALVLVLGSAGVLFFAVPMFLAAAAIKLQDGGPVFFRQKRIGRHGTPFTIYKLRTMVPDAEQRQQELNGQNGRSGPLFKVANDPRVTTVGRLLRGTSMDEIPQLWNVLKGEMSLVGPRPCLPSEAAQFDEELRARERLAPGITGLWQVEARDNGNFSAYRRLDLFYVENWSIALDLAILLSTVESVVL
ncbi:MAG: sugar transferase, partial [Candidatus Methylomirabilales bacterium]